MKFIPMNKKAKNYKWIITGYGIPIVTYYDTMSYNFYPFYNEFETITLITEDDSGCRDTMTQQIQLKDEITTIEGKLNDCELNALISPNPINNVLTLNFEIGDIKPNEVNIVDELGKIVYSQKGHFNLINYQYQINLDTLNSGLYFLSMNGDCYNYKSKFIKID